MDFVVSSGPEPTEAPTQAPTPTPSPAPTPTPVADLTVNDYRCLAFSDAQNQLEADGFTLGTVTAPPGFDTTWPVGGQDPAPGSRSARRDPHRPRRLRPGQPADLPALGSRARGSCGWGTAVAPGRSNA